MAMEATVNATLAALLRPIAFRYPRRLTPVSAWDEHVPFGMNLVDLLRPRVLVELGTHAGDSYCAFCQAVAELSSETRCYAVDTWRGDVHAGQYGDEVLAELRAHHDPLYAGFSRLVQSTFAEALAYFENESVDLLHIDGFHTFEAVKQDFESWLPKMSSRGVVLFHDTNVRERDFGVWDLWREVSGQYPHFEFVHGHGLGVLAVGEPPGPLVPLLEARDQEAAMVRVFFAEMGPRLAQEKTMRAGAAEREQLRRDVEQRERDIDELKRAIAALEKGLAALEKELLQERSAADARELAQLSVLEETQALRLTLQQIESSKAWRALQRYRLFRDRFAPEGSLGRRLYERALGRRS
jgi:hypothetical protein